jgi:hypothetical protein
MLFGKSAPQLDRLLATEDVRRMAGMEANHQIARKISYRVHSQSAFCRISSIESADNGSA